MRVELSINGVTMPASEGVTLFDHAEKLGMTVPTSCRKQGKCRECLVEVVEGMDCLSPYSPEEQHLQDGFRLSCRCRVTKEEGRVRCHTLQRGAIQVESSGMKLVMKEGKEGIDPAVSRDGESVLLDGKPIAQSSDPIHGLAMDIGTTTVSVRLINLETGDLVAQTSFENPQRFGGSDVMARIHHDSTRRDGLLRRVLLGYLTHTIEAFPVDPRLIYEAVVAGNSTMRDIIFGVDVSAIGQKPYRSRVELEWREGRRATTSLSASPRKMQLPIHPKGRVYGLPLVSGHVGADAAACLLAIDIAHQDEPVVLMDIGTNTELIVGTREGLWAASCPAGPAFEGGRIGCGMPALEGAIERIEIGPGGRVDTRVIGGGAPKGICASGLIDALSELLRTEQMNACGRFLAFNDPFQVDRDNGIVLHESDISELAQAKAANVSGLYIVLKRCGLDFSDISRFYLAGGFARHLDVLAAQRIGLIPQLDPSRIVQIGNAAIEGASQALLSKGRRDQLERLVPKIEHVELENEPDFFDYFVTGCQFAPLEPVPIESGATAL